MLNASLRCLAAAGILFLGVLACGGDDDDDVTVVDSGPGGGDSGACPVADSLGSFEPLDRAEAFHFTQGMDPSARLLSVGSDLSDSRVDLLLIQLWDGFGAFMGGQIKTGTFAIEGDEVALQTCGACIRLLADVQEDAAGNPTFKEYIATGGTLVVDSIGTRAANEITGNYTGSVSDLVLSEIDPDPMGNGSALAGGCESGIESATWDAVIENGDDEE